MATVEDLYRQVLGREPEPEGLAFWQNAFGGSVDPTEQASFMQAAQAELARRTPAEQAVLAPKLFAESTAITPTTQANPYFQANPDVAAAYQANSYGLTPEQFASFHYTNYGQAEGRSATPEIVTTTSVAPTAPINPTVKLYQDTLGRTPSQEEIDSWNFGSTIEPRELDSFLGAARNEAVNTMPTTGAVGNIANQILAQGTTDKWAGQGYGTPEKNAYDMAVMLAGQGISDINQFGQRTTTEGGQEYFNKATGEAIKPFYDRAGGNIWGGTFAGKDSTAYGVEFDASGNPLFYSQSGGDSADVPSWVVPALVLGGAYFGLDASGLLSGTAGGSLTAGITVADIAASDALLSGLTASQAASIGAAGGLGAGFTAAGLPSGTGAFLGENVVSGIPAWDTAFTGAGGMFNSAFGLPAGNGAFLGEGVPSGVPAWDAEYIKAGGVFDPAFALGPDGLVGKPLPPVTTTVIPPTTTPTTNFLNNLTPGQIANIAGGVGGLLGGAGVARAVTGGGGTGGGVGALPTQGVPLNTADYYNAIQQNYNRLLPAVPRDVATPLAQWYNSTYGA